MITRKRIKHFNKILTCLLCKGYLIEATTINSCMHSFCRSCIVKHVKVFEKYFCPSCHTEIRLSNLRPDMRLRSIVYKLVPGLHAKEHQQSNKVQDKSHLNGSLNGKLDNGHTCIEDESLTKQYFYDQDEPISLSLEYHMESIFGNTIALNNIPQIRYLQAPAAFKVAHLKKFLSSKYDLHHLKKSMNVDIIYEGEVLSDEFSLMDIAYAYFWEREAPLKLFYRIYKGSSHTSNKIKLIEKAITHQPYVRLSNELRDAAEVGSPVEVTKRSNGSAKAEAPRHDLKIIIAKKPSSKSENNNNKIKLNKLNGSKVLSDSVRLRGDVDNVHFTSATSSDFVSTSETRTTLSKKTGTVSHHDLKLENKSNTKKHSGSSSSDSHDYFEFTMNDREKEKSYAEKAKQHESTKHAKNNEKVEKFKASHKSNIPKLKIELPSLKTTILVPKTPTDSYFIASKSPGTPSKKVRFDISTKDRSYDFDDDQDSNLVDQTEYAAKIGLKPVKRTVDSIILHRKRKKSKHSKELPEHTKRPKLHVSSSLDESLKLKLKIMGGKSCKKSSNDEEARETCNFRAVPCKNDSTPKAHEEKQKNIREKQKEASGGDVVGLENHKYSVSEQRNVKSGSDQPMVFIPKLVLQKTKSHAADKKVYTIDTTQRRGSFAVDESKPPAVESTGESMKLKVKPFDSIASRDCASPKLMKPPTAKMGSPQQPHLTNSFSLSPIRPQSIPASLKFAPNSPSPPSSTSDIQHQNLKRSFSLGAEKSPQSYFNMFLQSNKDSFPSSSTSVQPVNAQKMPPLIPSSTSSLRNFFDAMANKLQSPQQTAAKMPKFSVKDPTKLFPNACPSVEILKIPQKTYSPINSIKLNRPMTSIPLERIRKSAQNPAPAKYLPKPPTHQHMVKPLGFQQSPQCSSQTSNSSGNNSPIIQDISLERYTLELTHDIAKLDRSLSLEKNFEHWERRKLQEYSSKLNDLKNFPVPAKNLLNQQQNLSVRNIPNPSAIIRNRNQTNNDSQKACNMSPQTVTSTNSDADIEEMLSKSTIARATGHKPEQLSSQKSPGSKVNDKKSIEKLTEYLRLTAAKSKDPKHDDDDNNNNSYDDSSANNRGGFKLMENKFEKFMNSVNVPSVDVICIDS